MKKIKKLLISLFTVVLTVIVTMNSAFACTMLYVGSDLTESGESYMARSEDPYNNYNQLAYVSPHGKHPAGETYNGCFLSFTFTHDSYAYTAVSDDWLDEECPDCGKTHEHTPYEEAGTNEMGVSISAMDSVYANEAVEKVDPLKDGWYGGDTDFMCEGDMTTVILGECATAREAVDLLCSIYETKGVDEGSGVQICDKDEAWYVENYTGSQYVAVKLSSQTVAFNANVGIIGLVDLDDTENVKASADVIKVAKEAGTFVGDEAENVIDFYKSYSDQHGDSRVYNGLNYLEGVDTYDKSNYSSDNFTISNIKDGEIVPFYSNIQLKENFSLKDMVDFYKVNTIGKSGNHEWHIFAVNGSADKNLATIEWLGIDHGGYSVAIPYFPLLTTELYEGYMVGGIGYVEFMSEVPEGATGYYPTTNRKGAAGFNVFPEGWEKGVYWANDVLSNFAESSACSAGDQAFIKAQLAVMQQKCYDKVAEMLTVIPTLSVEAAKVYATAESKALAKEAHELAVALYKEVAFGEYTPAADLFSDTDGIIDSFKSSIAWAVKNGVTNGFGNNCFKPNDVCTRAQAVTFLWRMAGSPAPETQDNPFSDVNPESVYYPAILWASENGIVNGYADGSFRPNDVCTRAQTVTFLWRFEGKPEAVSEVSLSDINGLNEEFTAAVEWAASVGITTGYADGSFRPNNACTRAHIVTFLFRDAFLK